MRLHLLLPLVAIILPACGGSNLDPDNPSGDCDPGHNGDRAGFSAGTDPYLPNCDLELPREYWRIFTQSETAYMIPRPDSTGLTYGICDGDDEALADLFERNGLCVEVAGSATVETINSMSKEDALAISSELHRHLSFEPVEEGDEDFERWRLSPYAPYDDIVEVCDRNEVDLSEAQDVCSFARSKLSGDVGDIARTYSEVEVNQLAPGLNKLYGVD